MLSLLECGQIGEVELISFAAKKLPRWALRRQRTDRRDPNGKSFDR
jgi:hypothetical protein